MTIDQYIEDLLNLRNFHAYGPYFAFCRIFSLIYILPYNLHFTLGSIQ